MMIDLRTLKDFPVHLSLEEEAESLDLKDFGVTVQSRVQVELNILRSEDIYYCSGTVVCKVALECSRCLESYPETLRGEVNFSIRESGETQPFDRSEVPENRIIVPAGAARVDITDPVREALILETPLKPLCTEECRGLCPVCGINRNEEECHCRVETSDSRWNGLRELQ